MADAAKFAHLHLHTHYSLLDGFNRIPTLVEQTKKLGMNAVAITDHGNLYGAIEFYEACKKGGINPIIGYEAYLAPNHRSEKTKTGGGSGEASTHLTLLAKNRTGFYNLIKLSSIAFLEGFYYKPRIDREVLERHSEGLICLSGCLAGQFNQHILADRIPDAEKLAKYFAKTFKNNFYIEIQVNGLSLQEQCTPVAAEIATRIGVPLVATADAHYLCASDAIAHDIYFCINTKRLHDPRKKTYPEEKMPNPYYVRSPQDMYKLFPDYADAVARTQQIADGVDIQLSFGRNFPVFKSPRNLTADEYLRELVLQGIKERYGDSPAKAVFDRMEIELDVIAHMGYSAYFLIVWDFVKYARDRGIRSTARGSGVGAIVAYTLYISHVCPLEYDLLFERFLDKSRKEPPDIDIDFDQERREEVIQYVKDKYGHKSVAQIGTFGTLGAKAALKDVGRVLSIPLERVNFMCKLVPMKGAISLELKDAMGVPDFKREYDTDPTARHWIDVAMKLEGMNRNVGTHAAGVVIASGDITDYVPVQRVMQKITTDDGEKVAGEVVVTTQWEMGVVEKVGMLKMDFLGLRNLTMLDNTVKLIKKTRGLDVVPEALPLDDEQTYKLLQKGDAKGVFQLESDGMRRLLMAMKPDNIRDLIAVLALYRPGPLESGMVESYVNRKHGREKFTYEHPVLEEVLAETYGVITYQEQIMRILNKLGGIELSKSYAVIKAISKKIPEKIEAGRADWMKGCADRGVSDEVAKDIFEKIVFFAGYGFNKCLLNSTIIVDADSGEATTIGELFATHRGIRVHALGEDGKLCPRRVTDVMWNGRKRVYRLTTELGHSITATGNHPFRTLNGWTNLDNLSPGSRVAAPRRLDIPTGDAWPRHQIIALAGLLSEGNTCHPSTLYFYGNDRRMIADFSDAIGRFPNTVAKVYARKGGERLEVQANTGVDHRFKPARERGGTATPAPPTRSGAFRWAEEQGVIGKKATEKRVPAGVFRLCDADLELFLGRLWAGDGFVANATLKVPFYATSSHGLAKDVQHLLLRLGIVSRIHNKQFKYRGGLKPGHTVHVLGDGAAETFLSRIAPHCLGRESAVEQLREHVATTTRGLTSKDTIPLEVREWVNAERVNRGMSWVEVEAQSGVSMQEFYGTPPATKTGFRRSTIAKLADFFNSPKLRAVATSDVFWDRVVSIESVGVEDTYDLTVEEDHNFVADGLIVHNSHTAAYAQIGYQTAYLKTHYTAEFMAALLSSEIDEGNKRDLMVEHIADARRLGVEVEAPNVNKGQPDFDVVNGKIVFGLTALKGLGRGAAEAVVHARDKGGAYRDLFDFCDRVDLRTVKTVQIEKLIKGGAMDCFGKDKRNAMLHALPRAVAAAEEKVVDKRRGQKSLADLFGGDDEDGGGGNGLAFAEGLPDIPEWPDLEKLKFEKEVLDFYMSSHPLAQYDEQLRRFRSADAVQCAKMKAGTEVRLAGMVIEVIPKLVSKGKNAGNRWAIVRIEDFSGAVKCILWSDQFQRFGDLVKADAILLFDGKVEWREGSGEPDVIVDRVMTMDEAKADLTRGLVLRMKYRTDDDGRQTFDSVGKILKKARGACPVYLTVSDAGGRAAQFKLSQDFFVNPTQVAVEQLEMILGPGSVLFTSR